MPKGADKEPVFEDLELKSPSRRPSPPGRASAAHDQVVVERESNGDDDVLKEAAPVAQIRLGAYRRRARQAAMNWPPPVLVIIRNLNDREAFK